MEPGVHDIPAEQYHAGDREPALSASVANDLLTSSPLHAWTGHPLLNPDYRREDKEIFDLGHAAHGWLLEGDSGFMVIEADDWRTKAAREQRDAARAARKTPILAHKWAAVQEMGEAVARQLEQFRDPPKPFSEGKAEQTLVWREGAVLCKARLDWLHDSRKVIDDLKTTGGSANPEAWIRTSLFGGPDIQAAFYLRGVKVLFGIDATFRFVVVENFPPYALSVISLGPQALVIAEKKRRLAVEIWERCLTSGKWPAYPDRTCHADLPPWIESSWIAREEREMGGSL